MAGEGGELKNHTKLFLIIFLAVLVSLFLSVFFTHAEDPAPPAPTNTETYGPSPPPSPTNTETYGPSPPPTTTTGSPSPGSSSGTSEGLSTTGTQLKAPNTSNYPTLKEALDPVSKGKGKTGWIFNIWNYCLSLVNIIVAGILIFLAFVNILRIQIDTYALKKALPTLIIAVILANFSMLICRMVVDFSDALTKTFAGDPKQLASDLQYAMGFVNASSGSTAGSTAAVGTELGILSFAVVMLFMGAPAVTLIALAIGFILCVIPGIGILILAFLLYVRTGVIYVLVAVSPLAFICMALPATQSFFKQWWGQFARWVFMAPVVFFLLKIASMVKTEPGSFSIWAYVISLGMLYLAILVPFKMGGAVMSVWSGLGKKLGGAGLKHAGMVADKKFGDATEKLGMKRWSPAGLYTGWKKSADMYWQRHQAEVTGTGMEVREGLTSLPGQILQGGKGGFWKAQPHYTQAVMEPLKKEAQNIATAYPFDIENKEIPKLLANATNQREAAQLVLAGTMAGSIDQKDIKDLYLKKWDRQYIKTNGEKITGSSHALINQASDIASKNALAPTIVNEWSKVSGGLGGGVAVKTSPDAVANRQFKNLQKKADQFWTPGNEHNMQKIVQTSIDVVNKKELKDFTENEIGHQMFLDYINKNSSRIKNQDLKKEVENTLTTKPLFNTIVDKGEIGQSLNLAGIGKEEKEAFLTGIKGINGLDIDISVPLKGQVDYVSQFMGKQGGQVLQNYKNFVTSETNRIKGELERGTANGTLTLERKQRIDAANVYLDKLGNKINTIQDLTSKSKSIEDLVKNWKQRSKPA